LNNVSGLGLHLALDVERKTLQLQWWDCSVEEDTGGGSTTGLNEIGGTSQSGLL